LILTNKNHLEQDNRFENPCKK